MMVTLLSVPILTQAFGHVQSLRPLAQRRGPAGQVEAEGQSAGDRAADLQEVATGFVFDHIFHVSSSLGHLRGLL